MFVGTKQLWVNKHKRERETEFSCMLNLLLLSSRLTWTWQELLFFWCMFTVCCSLRRRFALITPVPCPCRIEIRSWAQERKERKKEGRKVCCTAQTLTRKALCLMALAMQTAAGWLSALDTQNCCVFISIGVPARGSLSSSTKFKISSYDERSNRIQKNSKIIFPGYGSGVWVFIMRPLKNNR